jgi:hypothetical protein
VGAQGSGLVMGCLGLAEALQKWGLLRLWALLRVAVSAHCHVPRPPVRLPVVVGCVVALVGYASRWLHLQF